MREILFAIKGDASSALEALRTTESAIQRFLGVLRNIGSGAAKVGGGFIFDALKASAQTTASVIDQTFGRIQRSTSSFVLTLTNIGRSFFFLRELKTGIEGFATALGYNFAGIQKELEQYQVSFAGAMGLSQEQAKQEIAQLQELNKELPLSFEGLAQLNTRLALGRVRTEEWIRAIADAAAVLGGDINQNADTLATAITNISNGRQALGIRQITQELQLLGRNELVKNGIKFGANDEVLTDAKTTLDTIQRLFQEKFGAVEEIVKHSWDTILSNTQDATKQIRAAFQLPIADFLKPAFEQLSQSIATTENLGRAVLAGRAVVDTFIAIRDAATGLASALTSGFTTVVSFLDRVTGGFSQFAGAVIAAVAPLRGLFSALFGGDFAQAGQIVGTVLANLTNIILGRISELGSNLFTGGYNVIVAFANGLVAAGGTAVLSAVTYISNLIASYLQGFSPPKAGPLHTIDTWFPRVINAYLGSWTEADWSILTSMVDRIADVFTSLVERGKASVAEAMQIVIGTDQVPGLNQLMAEAVDQIAQTGKVSADLLLQIQQTLGDKFKDVFDILKAELGSAQIEHEIGLVQAKIAELDAQFSSADLDAALSAAQKALKKARSAAEAKAAQSQIDVINDRKSEAEQQKKALEAQLKQLKAQELSLKNIQAGYEGVLKLQERELQFMDRLNDIQKRRKDEESRLAEAAFRYQLLLATSAQKLELLKEKLKGVTAGSEEWYQIATEIFNVEEDLQKQAQRKADAEFEYQLSLKDTQGQLDAVRARQATLEQGSVEYYDNLGRIHDLEKKVADEATRKLDAEMAYQLATASSTQKRSILEEKLKKLNPNDPKQADEYFQIKTQIAQLDQEQADAQEQYNLELATTGGKIDILQKKQAGLVEGSAEWYKVGAQIHQLQEQQSKEAERTANAQDSYNKAATDAQAALEDINGKIAVYTQYLSTLDPSSKAYQQTLKKIRDLEVQRAKAAERLAKAQAAQAAQVGRAKLNFDLKTNAEDYAAQLAVIDQALLKTTKGSKEYYQLLTKREAIVQKMKKEGLEVGLQESLNESLRTGIGAADQMTIAGQKADTMWGQFQQTIAAFSVEGQKRLAEFRKETDVALAPIANSPFGRLAQTAARDLLVVMSAVNTFGQRVKTAFQANGVLGIGQLLLQDLLSAFDVRASQALSISIVEAVRNADYAQAGRLLRIALGQMWQGVVRNRDAIVGSAPVALALTVVAAFKAAFLGLLTKAVGQVVIQSLDSLGDDVIAVATRSGQTIGAAIRTGLTRALSGLQTEVRSVVTGVRRAFRLDLPVDLRGPSSQRMLREAEVLGKQLKDAVAKEGLSVEVEKLLGLDQVDLTALGPTGRKIRDQLIALNAKIVNGVASKPARGENLVLRMLGLDRVQFSGTPEVGRILGEIDRLKRDLAEAVDFEDLVRSGKEGPLVDLRKTLQAQIDDLVTTLSGGNTEKITSEATKLRRKIDGIDREISQAQIASGFPAKIKELEDQMNSLVTTLSGSNQDEIFKQAQSLRGKISQIDKEVGQAQLNAGFPQKIKELQDEMARLTATLSGSNREQLTKEAKELARRIKGIDEEILRQQSDKGLPKLIETLQTRIKEIKDTFKRANAPQIQAEANKIAKAITGIDRDIAAEPQNAALQATIDTLKKELADVEKTLSGETVTRIQKRMEEIVDQISVLNQVKGPFRTSAEFKNNLKNLRSELGDLQNTFDAFGFTKLKAQQDNIAKAIRQAESDLAASIKANPLKVARGQLETELAALKATFDPANLAALKTELATLQPQLTSALGKNSQIANLSPVARLKQQLQRELDELSETIAGRNFSAIRTRLSTITTDLTTALADNELVANTHPLASLKTSLKADLQDLLDVIDGNMTKVRADLGRVSGDLFAAITDNEAIANAHPLQVLRTSIETELHELDGVLAGDPAVLSNLKTRLLGIGASFDTALTSDLADVTLFQTELTDKLRTLEKDLVKGPLERLPGTVQNLVRNLGAGLRESVGAFWNELRFFFTELARLMTDGLSLLFGPGFTSGLRSRVGPTATIVRDLLHVIFVAPFEGIFNLLRPMVARASFFVTEIVSGLRFVFENLGREVIDRIGPILQSGFRLISSLARGFRILITPALELGGFLGRQLLPVFERLAKSGLALVFEGIGRAFTTVAAKTALIKTGLIALASFLNPIVGLAVALFNFADTLAIISSMFPKFRSLLETGAAAVGKFVENIAYKFVSLVENFASSLPNLVPTIVDWVLNGLQKAFTFLVSAATFDLGALIAPEGSDLDILNQWLQAIRSWAGPILESLKLAFGRLGRVLIETMSTQVPKIKAFARLWIPALTDWAKVAIPTMIRRIGEIVAGIARAIASGARTIAGSVTAWTDAFLSWLVGPENAQKTIPEKLFLVLGDVLAFIASSAVTIGTAMAGWADSFLSWLTGTDGQDGGGLALSTTNKLNLLFQQVLAWINAKAVEFGAGMRPWADAFLNWLGGIDSDDPDAKLGLTEKLGLVLAQMLDWIGQQVGPIAAQVGAWALALIGWIIQSIPGLLAHLTTFMGNVFSFIGKAAGPLLKKLGEWAAQFAAWLVPATVNFLKKWPDILSTILDSIAKFAGPLLAKLGDWAVQFVAWIIPMLPDLALALLGISAAIVTFIVETVVVLYDHIKQWAVQFFRWVKDEKVFEKLVAAFEEMKLKVGKWIIDAGSYIYTQALTWGKQLVDGIKKGLADWASSLDRSVGTWAEEHISKPFRRATGIKSPSRMMAVLGGYLAQGVVVGLDEGGTAVVKAVGRMADTIVGQVQPIGARVISTLSDSLSDLGPQVGALFGSGFSAAQQAAGQTAQQAADTTTAVRDKLKRFLGEISDLVTASGVGDDVKQQFGTIFGTLIGLIDNGGPLSEIARSIRTSFTDILGQVNTALGDSPIVGTLRGLLDQVGSIIADITTEATEAPATQANAATDAARKKLKDLLGQLADLVKNVPISDQLRQAFDTTMSGVMQVVDSGGPLDDAIGVIQDTFGTIIDQIASGLDDQNLAEQLNAVFGKVVDASKDAQAAVQQATADAAQQAAATAQDTQDAIADATDGTTVADSIKQAIDTAVDYAKARILDLIQPVKDVLSQIDQLFQVEFYTNISQILVNMIDSFYRAGIAFGNALAQGIKESMGAVVTELQAGLLKVADQLPHSEPNASDSPLRGITTWGADIINTIAGSMQDGDLVTDLNKVLSGVEQQLNAKPFAIDFSVGTTTGAAGASNLRSSGDIHFAPVINVNGSNLNQVQLQDTIENAIDEAFKSLLRDLNNT